MKIYTRRLGIVSFGIAAFQRKKGVCFFIYIHIYEYLLANWVFSQAKICKKLRNIRLSDKTAWYLGPVESTYRGLVEFFRKFFFDLPEVLVRVRFSSEVRQHLCNLCQCQTKWLFSFSVTEEIQGLYVNVWPDGSGPKHPSVGRDWKLTLRHAFNT